MPRPARITPAIRTWISLLADIRAALPEADRLYVDKFALLLTAKARLAAPEYAALRGISMPAGSGTVPMAELNARIVEAFRHLPKHAKTAGDVGTLLRKAVAVRLAGQKHREAAKARAGAKSARTRRKA